jgi:PPOX class probable F420-dependent enzyme
MNRATQTRKEVVVVVSTIPTGVQQLLDGPNYAHLATLMADGTPRSHVVWIWREGQSVIVPTTTGNAKARDMERNPRVSISLVDHENPYRMASIRGTVVETRPHDEFELMDQIARKYTSRPYPDRSVEMVYFVMQVTHAYERTLGGFSHAPAAIT